MKVIELQDSNNELQDSNKTDNFLELTSEELDDHDKISNCKHEFVFREYPSQPYGTCACCGKFILD